MADIKEFSFSVKGPTQHDTLAALDDFTTKFLDAVGSTYDAPWECVDEFIIPDPTWIPGEGLGNPRGYKAWRKFTPAYNEQRGGEIMGEPMTPEAPQETPEEETPDKPEEEQETTPEPQEDDENPEG